MKQLSHEEKRLDVVVKFFYPVVAGIETNILNIYSYLATQGWEVVIHTSTSTPDAPYSLPSTGEIRGLSIRRYRWHWYGFVPDIDWRRSGSVCLHNFNVFPHSWMLFLDFHWPGFCLVNNTRFTTFFLTSSTDSGTTNYDFPSFGLFVSFSHK